MDCYYSIPWLTLATLGIIQFFYVLIMASQDVNYPIINNTPRFGIWTHRIFIFYFPASAALCLTLGLGFLIRRHLDVVLMMSHYEMYLCDIFLYPYLFYIIYSQSEATLKLVSDVNQLIYKIIYWVSVIFGLILINQKAYPIINCALYNEYGYSRITNFIFQGSAMLVAFLIFNITSIIVWHKANKSDILSNAQGVGVEKIQEALRWYFKLTCFLWVIVPPAVYFEFASAMNFVDSVCYPFSSENGDISDCSQTSELILICIAVIGSCIVVRSTKSPIKINIQELLKYDNLKNIFLKIYTDIFEPENVNINTSIEKDNKRIIRQMSVKKINCINRNLGEPYLIPPKSPVVVSVEEKVNKGPDKSPPSSARATYDPIISPGIIILSASPQILK